MRVGFLRGICDRVKAAKGFVVAAAFPNSARVDFLTLGLRLRLFRSLGFLGSAELPNPFLPQRRKPALIIQQVFSGSFFRSCQGPGFATEGLIEVLCPGVVAAKAGARRGLLSVLMETYFAVVFFFTDTGKVQILTRGSFREFFTLTKP